MDESVEVKLKDVDDKEEVILLIKGKD